MKKLLKMLRHRTGSFRKTLLVLTLIVTFSCVIQAGSFRTIETYAATQADKEALEAQLAKNKQQLDALETKIASLRNQESSIVDLKSELDSEINTIQSNIAVTNDLIAKYNDSIDEKIDEISVKEIELNDRYSKFKAYLKTSYEDGYANYIGMVLDSGNFTDFLTRMERLGNLMEYEQTLLNELNQETEDLKALKNSLEGEKQRNEELKSSLQASQNALKKKLDDAVATIKKIENETAQATADRQKIIAGNKELDSELQKVLADLARQSQSNYVGGEFLWPLDLKHNNISSGYGWRELWGSRDYHLGIDITAPCNSNVYASNSGTVVKAEYHWSYGNYVVIDHGGGISTLYAHNTSLNVRVGDSVKRGDVIAFVGTTGSSTGYHCHFEIRINGVTQNPLNGYVVKP